MGVKESLLYHLEQNREAKLSGEALSRALNVSRNAVWKAVQALRAQGFPIESAQGKGYWLSSDADRLSAQGIALHLGEGSMWSPVVLHDVDSTNAHAKRLAAEGAREGTVVFSERQHAGRGRMRRAFFSPDGSGLYMTAVLRPQMPVSKALGLTTAAAVAVCAAAKEIAKRDAKIKWVNDVTLDGKKLCGILTEAQFSLEGGSLEYAVVGIGINVRTPEGGFPPEIADVACSLFPAGESVPAGVRCRLAALVLQGLEACLKDVERMGHMDAYRALCDTPGREINVVDFHGTRPAVALAVEDDFTLRVRFTDTGETCSLSSSEVSIRQAKEKTT